MSTAARAIGLARGALEDATAYAQERRQFGQAIGEFQNTRFRLARMATEAYGTFRHPAVVPLVQYGPNCFLAELFHGPTLSFKDVALQLVGRLFAQIRERCREPAGVVALGGRGDHELVFDATGAWLEPEGLRLAPLCPSPAQEAEAARLLTEAAAAPEPPAAGGNRASGVIPAGLDFGPQRAYSRAWEADITRRCRACWPEPKR